jgi:thymidylate synthase ThyX
LVRHHEGCEKFVHSQREDKRVLGVPRDELPQGTLNDMDMTCNAQAFMNISRKRLCSRASKETREA